MAEEVKGQSATERAKAIEEGKKSAKPLEIADEMARKDLDFKQKMDESALAGKYQQKKQEVQSAVADKKADLMVAVAPDKKEEVSKAIDAAAAKAPDVIAASPAQPGATAPDTAPAAEAKAEGAMKGMWDKVKDFFSKFIEGIPWLAKLFNMGKKEESKTETASATATSQPSAAPSARPEYAPGNKENWRSVIAVEAQRLGIEQAFAEAIINVEAGKSGINPDGSLKIRFEPHILNDMLRKKGISKTPGGWGASKLNGRNVDGVSCEGGQAGEHACLKKAMEIDRDAAMNSISMGLGQIMGFNAKLAGYGSAEDMFNRFSVSGGGEAEQIRGMFKVIEKTPVLLNAARSKNFSRFSSAYNGAKEGSAKHSQYMAALQRSYTSSGGGKSAAA